MFDIILGIIKIFVLCIIVLSVGILLCWLFIKFFEFVKGDEGDDYKR